MPTTTPMKTSPFAPFRGMMPIMPTAIDASGRLDEKSQRRIVQYCLKNGAVAIGHFGFASEGVKIPPPERRALIEMIVDEVAHRVPVFIGVTAPSNRFAAHYAREAEDLGANMLMAAPPFLQSPGPEGLYAYYKDIAESVSLPVIIQDAGDANVMPVELMLRLYNEIENVHFVKSEASDFVRKSFDLIRLSGGRMPVIGGYGGKHMIHLLRAGVTAFMTGTEALDLHYAVVAAYLRGDEDKAARLYYDKMLPYLMFYLEHSYQLLKQMLHLRGVMDCPLELAPASRPMSDDQQREFKWILERVGLTVRWPDISWESWQ
jgi:2-keto-3-deoxy-L-arabinonate dehydratase